MFIELLEFVGSELHELNEHDKHNVTQVQSSRFTPAPRTAGGVQACPGAT